MQESASSFRQRLRNFGFSDPAITAAWPTWWSDDADASSSARAELRFSVARKLGLDPHSLLEDEREPRFIWRDEARFKHLTGQGELELSGITSFGMAVAAALLGASTSEWTSITGRSATELRHAILKAQQYVRLIDLLSLCWGVGVPVIHLRVFPWTRKRMAAMTVRLGNRSAVLLGRDSMYPARIAFYLAHEVAHISLGHLETEQVLVDLDLSKLASPSLDPEEALADSFALELLTGEKSPKVLSSSGQKVNAPSLAHAALNASTDLAIEPGILALCFGYSTGNWAVANSAMRLIYSSRRPVWREINKIALTQLSFVQVPEDTRSYLEAVLGNIEI